MSCIFFKPGSSWDLFVFATFFIFFWPAMAVSGLPPGNDGLCPQYIWIDCAQQSRHRNGALTQYYYIRRNQGMDPDGLAPGDYTAIYRFRIRSRPKKRPYGFDLLTPKEGCFAAPVVWKRPDLPDADRVGGRRLPYHNGP